MVVYPWLDDFSQSICNRCDNPDRVGMPARRERTETSKKIVTCIGSCRTGLRRRRRAADFETYSGDNWGGGSDSDDGYLGPMISKILGESTGRQSRVDEQPSVTNFEVEDGRVTSSGGSKGSGNGDYQSIVQQVEHELDSGGYSTEDNAQPRTILVKRKRSHRREDTDFITHAPLRYYPSRSSNVVEDVDEVISLVADYIDLERGVGDKLIRFIEDLAVAVKSKPSCSSKKVELSPESVRQFADDYDQIGEDLKDDREILTNVRRYLELLSSDPKAHRALRKLMKPLDRLVRNTHALQDATREIAPVVEELQQKDSLGELMVICSTFNEAEMENRLRSIDHVYSDLSSGFDSLAYSVIVSARFAKARGASVWAKAYNANFSRSVTCAALPRLCGESPIQGYAEQMRSASFIQAGGNQELLGPAGSVSLLTLEALEETAELLQTFPWLSVGMRLFSLCYFLIDVEVLMRRSNHIVRFARARGISLWADEYNRCFSSASRKILLQTGECPREGFAEQHRGGELIVAQAMTGSDSSPIDGIDLDNVTEEQKHPLFVRFHPGFVDFSFLFSMGRGNQFVRFARARGTSAWATEYNRCFTAVVSRNVVAVMGESPAQGFAEQRRGGELIMGQALSGSDSSIMDGVDMEDLTDEQIVSWNMITGFGPGVGAVPPEFCLVQFSQLILIDVEVLMRRSNHIVRFARARGISLWADEYNRCFSSASRKILLQTGECPREGFAEQHRGGELIVGQAMTGSDSSPIDGIDLDNVTEEQLVSWNIISFLGGGISSWSKEGMSAGARFARARGTSSFARAYNANFARSVSTLGTLPRIVGEAPLQGFAEQIPPMISMSISSEMTSAGGCAAKTIPEDELEEMIALVRIMSIVLYFELIL
ncbi:hypothetical protein FOL47_008108 [Perkinsus chesapeaki]|uniref:Uncharacterized protein n=1 Tax=Perkinsus chesapeaki TaxID=330153 RepID=A0A7J6LHD1_PERCH|nr:hypothetical protein FOL47_008108 [Perkinsus chesapeaki]